MALGSAAGGGAAAARGRKARRAITGAAGDIWGVGWGVMGLGSAAGRGGGAARARKSRRAITGSVWHIGGCAWLIYRRPFPFYDSSRSGWLLSSSTLCQVVEHDVDRSEEHTSEL